MVTIGLRGHSWMAEVTPNYTSTCESGTMLDDEVITVHYYTPCTPVVLYPICQPLFRPWRSLEVTGEWGHPTGGCHLRFFSDHMFFGFAVGVKTSDPGQLHTCTPTFRAPLRCDSVWSSRKRKATQVLTESKHIWAAKRPDKQPKQGYRGHNPTIENHTLGK